QPLCALPWVSCRRRRARRIQWQVHDQPDGVARQLAGNTGRTLAHHLPQLLLSSPALAVHRPAPCRLRPLGVSMPGLARIAARPAPSTGATDLAADVLAGLTAEPKTLPAKYFYDNAGSRLFERITELPEYYLTRAELGILNQCAADMAARLPAGGALIEFGSGSSAQAALRLRAGPPFCAS